MNMRTEESVIMNMRTEESVIMNMKKRECHSEYEEESAIVRLLGMAGCFFFFYWKRHKDILI